MPAKTKSSRNSRTGIIIISAMVALVLALGGWYLYSKTQSQQNNTNITNTTQNETKTNDTINPNDTNKNIETAGEMFRIPELGIRFVLPEGLEGLEYEMVDLSDGGKSARFTTTEIRNSKDATEYCLASKGALGGLVKFTYDPTNKSDENTAFQLSLFKIGSNYFGYQGSQQPCSQDEDIAQKQLDLSRKLNTSLRSAEAY